MIIPQRSYHYHMEKGEYAVCTLWQALADPSESKGVNMHMSAAMLSIIVCQRLLHGFFFLSYVHGNGHVFCCASHGPWTPGLFYACDAMLHSYIANSAVGYINSSFSKLSFTYPSSFKNEIHFSLCHCRHVVQRGLYSWTILFQSWWIRMQKSDCLCVGNMCV